MKKHHMLAMIAGIILLFTGASDCIKAEEPTGLHNSMYCWYTNGIPEKDLEKAIQIFQYLDVKDAYVSFGNPKEQTEMIKALAENGISTYYLTGDTFWYEDLSILKREIDKVADYNAEHPEAQLAGIVFDVEPYSLTAYKSDVITGFATYADTMQEAYAYAKEKQVGFVKVIPYWYDSYMTNEEYTPEEKKSAQESFEKVIRYADRISVMNYLRRDLSKHMQNEASLAKKYGIEIESAAEFTKADGISVEENITYFEEEHPITTVNKDWKVVYESLAYEKLGFSYHHLSVLLDRDILSEDYITPDGRQKKKPGKQEEHSGGGSVSENKAEEKPKEHEGNATVAEGGESRQNPTPADVTEEDKYGNTFRQEPGTPEVEGSVLQEGKLIYKVKKNAAGKARVHVIGVRNKKTKTVSIPEKVTLNGVTYKVTGIAAGAFRGLKKAEKITVGKQVSYIAGNTFKGLKKLKYIRIKTVKLKSKTVKKNAFRGIRNKVKIKVPKEKKTAYRKLFVKRGLKKTVTVK
ncbi:MAG: leucine-rich repeat protein [Lachnospiraceae bacterium]|nr:leucine-rich repeat protein [Lachnospiraceae bacterium]